MKQNNFYNIIHEEIENLTCEELKELVKNISRKIPVESQHEVIHMIKKEKLLSNNIIEEIMEDLERINNEEILFHGEFAESYEYDYYGFVGWQYTDPENIDGIISSSFNYAKKLIANKYYYEGLEILDTIINIKYSAYDESSQDIYDVTLMDINYLLSISIKDLCSYTLYAVYQIDNTNYDKLFTYLKKDLFKNSSIKDIELCGSEIPEDPNDFMFNWIDYLLKQKENIKDKYLKEALEYIDFENYEKYLDKIIFASPSLTIDLLLHFLKENDIKTAIELSKNILSKLNDNNIKREVLKLIKPYDEENENDYLFEIFNTTYNIDDLLELLVKTNEYNNKLKSIDYSGLNDKDNYIINYFLNNFIDTKIDSKYKVISLLFLITPMDAKNYLVIESMFTETISINKELLHKWKKNLNIDSKIVDKIVKKLTLYIDEYFEKIIETKAIKEYDYCALVIVLLKEYDSDKQNYYKKYITIAKNRETFKKCLKKYKEG